jgi:3-methyl-2-oxobutanoate hydroxymethyltransferase
MGTNRRDPADREPKPPRPVTVPELVAMKNRGERIVMTTAYDALFAELVDRSGVDAILVGDSVGPLLCGEQTTLAVTVEQMAYHGRLVVRGVQRALVVVDLPFLSYQVSRSSAIANAGRIMKETGCAAVKLEGGAAWAPTVKALTDAGIPVMGHLGLTPQAVHVLGGHRVQGRGAPAADRLVQDALALESAGAFAIVLELVPSAVAERVTQSVKIPTIGIGAGAKCDGQVLVLHDMLGLNEGFHPKFLKKYAELGEQVLSALRCYASEVRSGSFPDGSHAHD